MQFYIYIPEELCDRRRAIAAVVMMTSFIILSVDYILRIENFNIHIIIFMATMLFPNNNLINKSPACNIQAT